MFWNRLTTPTILGINLIVDIAVLLDFGQQLIYIQTVYIFSCDTTSQKCSSNIELLSSGVILIHKCSCIIKTSCYYAWRQTGTSINHKSILTSNMFGCTLRRFFLVYLMIVRCLLVPKATWPSGYGGGLLSHWVLPA